MTWTFTDSLPEYRTQAGDFLTAYPAENTVLLTLLHRLEQGRLTGGDPGQAPRHGWWRPSADAPVAGAWLQTPPQGIRLSTMPVRAAVELADLLADAPDVTGVGGGTAEARAFADAWAAHTGATATVHEEQRLYRLGELAVPAVPGRLRPATPDDHELLVPWLAAFFEFVGFPGFDAVGIATQRTLAGEFFIWEDEAGRPVSLAGLSQVIVGMTRIGPVYTPPEARGHGYASAVTAGICEVARERGATEVLLYTDLANPTSNSIYQKIGFRPVADSVIINFRK
ncbi:GNAT family N-acetyltransferase [Kitasatospora acidiphila]|uniref:GNAT family N-acetyltransferase n=1 Tax=Kitasatospora acidiphila TaxID=2567942 RepID=A0A540W3N7_9ACTN|nr:GNAT family N-acetyltransferase [Kitasatospora acidiphila]TQF03646.1 GNAT family N-acetyltransferase [Kitasatospora acidiphila]